VVRQGFVRVKEHARSWFFSINWLVLTDTHLALHTKHKAPRATIPLSDITRLERAEHERYGLILETRGNQTYFLVFGNDNDIYGWKDAISYRTAGISNPWSFRHDVHVGWNPVDQTYTGLPPEWDKLLSGSSGSPGKPDYPNFSRPMPIGVQHTPTFTLLRRPFVPLQTAPSISDRILLRVSISTTTDPGHTSICLSVTPDTPMRTVLERVCRKTKLDMNECSLSIWDSDFTLLDMDVKVADLKSRSLILLTPDQFV